MTKRFTQPFKIQAVQKALSRTDDSNLEAFSLSIGVGYSTLQNWIRQSKNQTLDVTQADIHHYEKACKHVATAGKVLVIGTSLSVFPVAAILDHVSLDAEKVIITKDIAYKPPSYVLLKGNAATLVPSAVNVWLNEKELV